MSFGVKIFLALLLALPAQAKACMEHPVPNAIIYGTKPSVQNDSFLVKIEVSKLIPKSFEVRAKVLEGPKSLKGKIVRLYPENLGSCTTLGRRKGYAVIQQERYNARSGLIGLAFERSWLDWLADILGFQPYLFPSNYKPPFRSQ